jgi:hypothetical protein
MKKKLFIVLQSVLILATFTYVYAKENIWVTFVNEPNEANYQICRHQVKDSLSGKYEDFKSPTYLNLMEDHMFGNVAVKVIGKVMLLIDEGNTYASDLTFQMLPLFYNNLALFEEMQIELGKLTKRNPELYLALLKKYKHDYNLLGLANYGDKFVDDIDAQIKETQERIEALQKVHKKELQILRDRCIAYLKDREINLQKEKRKEQWKEADLWESNRSNRGTLFTMASGGIWGRTSVTI